MRIGIIMSCLCLCTGLWAQEAKKDDPIKGEKQFLMDGIYKEWTGTSYKWGFHNGEEEVETQAVYDTIGYHFINKKKFGYYLVSKGSKWGLLNKDRSTWIPMEYDQLRYNHRVEPASINVSKDKKYGILNDKGNTVLGTIYDEILYDGFSYKVMKDSLWGLMDLEGKILIEPCFNRILHRDAIAQTLLQKGSKWTIQNWVKGQSCSLDKQFLFDYIEEMGQYFIVRNADKFGVYNLEGKVLLPLEYDYISPFFLRYLNTVLISKNRQLGLQRIEKDGSIVEMIPMQYDDIWVDNANMKIKVRKGEYRDYYFKEKPLFDLKYNEVNYHKDYDFFMAKNKGKWGLIDINEKIQIPFKYQKIHIISERSFLVQKSNKWGVVNKRGEVTIPIAYDEFNYKPELNAFAMSKKGKWGLSSLRVGVLLEARYDEILALRNRKYLVRIGDKWGVVAAGNREIVPVQYADYAIKPGKLVLTGPEPTKRYEYNILR